MFDHYIHASWPILPFFPRCRPALPGGTAERTDQAALVAACSGQTSLDRRGVGRGVWEGGFFRRSDFRGKTAQRHFVAVGHGLSAEIISFLPFADATGLPGGASRSTLHAQHTTQPLSPIPGGGSAAAGNRRIARGTGRRLVATSVSFHRASRWHSSLPWRLPFWQSLPPHRQRPFAAMRPTLAINGRWGASPAVAVSPLNTTVYNTLHQGHLPALRTKGLGRISRPAEEGVCHFLYVNTSTQ